MKKNHTRSSKIQGNPANGNMKTRFRKPKQEKHWDQMIRERKDDRHVKTDKGDSTYP